MATIANLDVNLRANTLQYQSKMNSAIRTNQRFAASSMAAGKSVVSMAGNIRVAIAAAVAFGGPMFAINKAVQGFADTGDQIAKGAKQLQITATEYQSLDYAIKRNGGSSNTLKTAIRGLTRNYFDLERGLSTARDSFRELGLTQADLIGLSPAEQFRLVVQKLGQITDASKKAAIAQKVFGRSGLEIIPLIDGLQSAEDRFKALGLDVGPRALKFSEDIKDANLDMALSYQKISAALTTTFGPAILKFTEGISFAFLKAADYLEALERRIIEFRFGYKIQGLTAAGREGFAEYQRQESNKYIIGGAGAEQGLFMKYFPRIAQALPQFIDSQIEGQRQLVESLRATSMSLQPLPQALQKGTAAQVGFINNLKRQQEQSELRAQEKKKIDLAEKQLKKLEDMFKEQKMQTQLLEGESIL